MGKSVEYFNLSIMKWWVGFLKQGGRYTNEESVTSQFTQSKW